MNRFFGSSRNCLFSLSPSFSILRSKSNGNGSYQWLNTKTYGAPHGLGFGGTRERFRLFIPDTLERCTLKPNCLTYECGCLLDEADADTFEIDCIEIWGCGGEEAISRGRTAQQLDRSLKSDAIEKARKVDKAQFFNNSFDQEFLLSNTLQHRQQTSDRDFL